MNHSFPSHRRATYHVPALRIALLTYSTKPRGSVVHTLELAIALHALGHYVCVYALDKDGQGFDRNLPCPVDLITAHPAPANNMDDLIRQRIQEFVDGLSDRYEKGHLHYDIFHAQDCLSANALTELRQRYTKRQTHEPCCNHPVDGDRAPVVPHLIRTVHHIEDYTSPYLQDCQDRSIREADVCICVSQHWQHHLKHHYDIEAPRVINGIDTERFTPSSNAHYPQEMALRNHLGIQSRPDGLVYLTVGGIEPRKNSMRLLQAFAQVLNTNPQAQLVIAGGATLFDYDIYREEFFAEVERLGIAIGSSLILPGVMSDDDLACLYRVADAFVFPSIKEGWGMVVLEAIASGLPVMIPNEAPFTEFLGQEQALWIDPYDVDAIAQSMHSLSNPSLRQSLVSASQPVLSHYTWDTSAHLHINHYGNLIQASPLPTSSDVHQSQQ
ncbi:MAG: MSMEG_0565 family glycosyltransferase [Merismopedia sp. SIO2A8]|nr:MSMEG_0565 family glycosyltransferase [Merismopedia sp. SIO2A8]